MSIARFSFGPERLVNHLCGKWWIRKVGPTAMSGLVIASASWFCTGHVFAQAQGTANAARQMARNAEASRSGNASAELGAPLELGGPAEMGGSQGMEMMELGSGSGSDGYGSYEDQMEMGSGYGDSGYDQSGYGGSGYGSGGPGAGGFGQSGGFGIELPTPLMMLGTFQPDWSPFMRRVGELAVPSTSNEPVVLGPVLFNEAHVAYRYGNLPLALQLIHGHLARGDDAAIAVMDRIRFSKHFRRPTWHLRLGVSMGIHGDSSTDKPSPITAKSGSGQGGMGMGMDGGMGLDGGMGMDSGMRGGMGMEGDMGMDMDMGMGMDMGGEMGMEGDMRGMGSSGMRGPGMNGPGMNGRGRSSAMAIPPAQMTDTEVDKRMKDLLGLVAETVEAALRERVKSGDFGMALADVELESKTQGHTVNDETVDASEQKMWIPSVLFVGEMNWLEAAKTANGLDVDLLFHFDIGLKENRVGSVSNVSRLKVIDCRSGKTLISSGGMDNKEVERLTRGGRSTPSDYVDEQLKSLWQYVDERLTLSDLPELTPAIARKRVTQVLGDQSMSTLRKLAEIRYYGHRGWLTPAELEQAFEITAGADGMTILHGSDTQALEAIHQLVQATMDQPN